MPDKRSAPRKAVGLLVKLAYRGVEEFAQKYATNLSAGGLFIRTREPKLVGTELHFRVEIANGQRVLQGLGVVRWVRSPEGPVGPPGMGIEFLSLDDASRALVERMLRARPAPAAPVAPLSPIADIPPPRPPSEGLPSWLFRASPSEVGPAQQAGSAGPAAGATTPPPSLPAPPPVPAKARPQSAPPAPPPAAPQAEPGAALDFVTEAEGVIEGEGPMPVALGTELSTTEFVTTEAAVASEEEVFSTVVASGVWGGAEAGPAKEVDFATEIDLDLAELVASTPEPPVGGPDAAEAATEFDIDVELVAPSPLPREAASRSTPRAGAAEAPLPVPPGPPRPSPAPTNVEPAQPPVVLREARPASTPPRAAGPVFLQPAQAPATTGPIIGVDLGTTNSACAVLSKGRPVILSSKDGYNTIPSVVSLTQQGRLLVGHRAKAQMILNPTQSIFGAKRLVGRPFDSPTVRQVRERFHYEICAGDEGRAAVRLGPHVLALEEVQGLVLRECKEMAEQALGQPVSRAVVTCPAYYSEPQREAVRRAGQLAGLKVERILNEPTAAALAFGMNRELSKTVLVYDLGGGTFDATVLRVDKNVFEVLATGGDVFLGGVDFDNQIVDWLLERYTAQHGQSFSGDRVALSRIAEVAEKAKVALSERTSFEVHLPMLELDASGTPRDLRCTISRADVERTCDELVDRTIQAVQDVLLDAKLKASEVDDVILVGGMSRMPLVRERLQKVFKKPGHASVNADEAVALGAALYTGSVDKVSSVVLIDVVPMTIGLGKPGGGFHRLIERNTPLPATKSFGISTHEDNQQELELLLFQGEDANVAGNELLGALRIDGLPKGPKGAVQVAISLSLDAECVLKVEAREFRTRKAVKATLATRFTAEEVARTLKISDAKSTEAQSRRALELEKRAGGFWSRLKKVLGRGR